MTSQEEEEKEARDKKETPSVLPPPSCGGGYFLRQPGVQTERLRSGKKAVVNGEGEGKFFRS